MRALFARGLTFRIPHAQCVRVRAYTQTYRYGGTHIHSQAHPRRLDNINKIQAKILFLPMSEITCDVSRQQKVPHHRPKMLMSTLRIHSH